MPRRRQSSTVIDVQTGNFSLYPRYTVRENLEFPLKPKIRRLPDAEIKDRVDRAARTLRIEHLLDTQRRAVGRPAHRPATAR